MAIKKMQKGGKAPVKNTTRADEKRAAASMGKRKVGGSVYKKGGSTKK